MSSDQATGAGAGKVAKELQAITKQLEVQNQLLNELNSLVRMAAMSVAMRAMNPDGLTEEQYDKFVKQLDGL